MGDLGELIGIDPPMELENLDARHGKQLLQGDMFTTNDDDGPHFIGRALRRKRCRPAGG